MGYASRAASSSTPMAASVTSSGRSTAFARTRNGVGCPAEVSCSSPVRGVSWPNSTVTKRSVSAPKSGCSSRPFRSSCSASPGFVGHEVWPPNTTPRSMNLVTNVVAMASTPLPATSPMAKARLLDGGRV